MRFMFIGSKFERAFGPVVVFGFGGIYVEVFKDVQTRLSPRLPHGYRERVIPKNMRGDI
jgi:hypothetical protein